MLTFGFFALPRLDFRLSSTGKGDREAGKKQTRTACIVSNKKKADGYSANASSAKCASSCMVISKVTPTMAQSQRGCPSLSRKPGNMAGAHMRAT
jgi:hypothetical protein